MPAQEAPAVEELLRQAAAGDVAAAGRVVVTHDQRLGRVIRLRLDPRVARRVGVDDVLQEVHVEALQRLPEFLARREVPLLVWLRFLAVQSCMTMARRHLDAGARDARREQRLAEPAAGDASSVALEQALAASLTSPSGAAVRDETRDRLRAAVEKLEPLDREILCLRHFEGLDNMEASVVLGIARAAASKRYVRALAQLRDVLAAAGLENLPSGS